MKNISIHSFLLSFIIVVCTGNYSFVSSRSTDTLFFNGIEDELRADYKACTGDSTRLPLKKVILWKQSIDSITQLPEFTQILKQFYNDSSIAAGHHSPCEIARWYRTKMLVRKKSENIANTLIKNKNQKKADSLLIKTELSKVHQSSCDYLKIPFGISKECVIVLLKDVGVTAFIDDTFLLHYNNPEDSVYNTVAFYFDKNRRYYKYEIESVTASLDSLDTYIRPFAGTLALYYEQKIGQPAQQNNYIGRLDIVQGKLSISKIWELQNIEVCTGLATFNNRYYAKAIVTEKALKNSVKLH
jgi:hypothetical protein